MSQLIGMLEAAKGSANLVREYALDHYVHFGFLPNDVDVDGHVFDYEIMTVECFLSDLEVA